MRSRLSIRGVFLLAAWGWGLCVLMTGAGCKSRSSQFTILLKDAKSLSVGSEVTCVGAPIGKVTQIAVMPDQQVAVQVRIKPPKDVVIPVNCGPWVEKDAEGSGQSSITLLLPDNPGPPIAKGSAVQGLNNRFDRFRWEMKAGGSRVSAEVEKGLTEWWAKNGPEVEKTAAEFRSQLEALNKRISTLDVDRLRKDIESLTEDMAKSANKAAEQLEKRLLEVQKEAEVLAQKLSEAGKTDEAREVKAQCARMIERMRRALDSGS